MFLLFRFNLLGSVKSASSTHYSEFLGVTLDNSGNVWLNFKYESTDGPEPINVPINFSKSCYDHLYKLAIRRSGMIFEPFEKIAVHFEYTMLEEGQEEEVRNRTLDALDDVKNVVLNGFVGDFIQTVDEFQKPFWYEYVAEFEANVTNQEGIIDVWKSWVPNEGLGIVAHNLIWENWAIRTLEFEIEYNYGYPINPELIHPTLSTQVESISAFITNPGQYVLSLSEITGQDSFTCMENSTATIGFTILGDSNITNYQPIENAEIHGSSITWTLQPGTTYTDFQVTFTTTIPEFSSAALVLCFVVPSLLLLIKKKRYRSFQMKNEKQES